MKSQVATGTAVQRTLKNHSGFERGFWQRQSGMFCDCSKNEGFWKSALVTLQNFTSLSFYLETSAWLTMANEFHTALRASAKGSGWSVKRDILTLQLDGHVAAVHPRRGPPKVVELHAKPMVWDHLLWSILQISGNEQLPKSFHFIGAFTCDTPALATEEIDHLSSPSAMAEQLIAFAKRYREKPAIWAGYDLAKAIKDATPQEAYRFHMTRVVERIDAGDRASAAAICEEAEAGKMDIRRSFSSTDKQTPPDVEGRRPSLSFFELAQVWMRRN